jgi:hypothetical protein
MLRLASALTVGPLMAGDWYSKAKYGSGIPPPPIIIIIMSMSFMSMGGKKRKATAYRYDAPGGTSTFAITVEVAGLAVQVLARLEEA